MSQEAYQDIVFYLFVGIAVTVVLAFLSVALCSYLNDFSRELKYLNTEIRRNTGSERQHWLRRRRRLWLSLLPFVKY